MWDAMTGSSFDYKNNHELLEFAVLLMLRKSFFLPCVFLPSQRWQCRNCSVLVKRGPAPGKGLGGCPGGCSEMPGKCLLTVSGEWGITGMSNHSGPLRVRASGAQFALPTKALPSSGTEATKLGSSFRNLSRGFQVPSCLCIFQSCGSPGLYSSRASRAGEDGCICWWIPCWDSTPCGVEDE